VKTDYTKPSLVKALKGQDAVVSFLGFVGMAKQPELLEAAEEVGVKRFIPSEFGHNTAADLIGELVPVLGKKRELVKRIDSENKVEWTAIVNGYFFEFGIRGGYFGVDPKSGKAELWDEGTVPFSTTSFRTIGESIVKLLTDPAAYEASKNKYIYLATHTTTQKEVLEIEEKLTGKKFDVTSVNSAEVIAENREKQANGDRSAISAIIKSLAFARYDGKALCDYRQFGIFNDEFGIKSPSLEEDIKRLLSPQ
jgi:NmrA-like family protein